MINEEKEKNRKQMQIVCIDDLVPQDHLLRIIDKAIDWSFIYDLLYDLNSSHLSGACSGRLRVLPPFVFVGLQGTQK